MNRTILVPLDGSSLAERAVPYAQTLANATGARILLLRAVDEKGPINSDQGDQVSLEREAESYLAEIVARLGKPSNVETAVFVGDPTTAILDEIRLRDVGLLVMSTHGTSGIGPWIYGRVADQIMRCADVPILLIPAHCEQPWSGRKAHRIVVPLDGSEFAREALGPACDLARAVGAEIVLMHVIVPPTYTYADVTSYVFYDPSDDRARACHLLEEVARDLREQGFRATLYDAVGFPAATIAEATTKVGASLIAMSTHGRGGLSQQVMGSVATGVVQRATAPILIVRPSDVRRYQRKTGSDGKARSLAPVG